MESNFNKAVGKRLYSARKAKGYSRAKVGELVGLHETTIKRYEDGDIKSLDIERLKSFSDALGIPAAQLLGWVSADESDENLTYLFQLSKEKASGRLAAVDAMKKAFGSKYSEHETGDFNTNSAEVNSSKMSILYYNTFATKVTTSISSVISYFEPLSGADAENLMYVIRAYLDASLDVNSDAKTIVDLTLKPYMDKEQNAREFTTEI